MYDTYDAYRNEEKKVCNMRNDGGKVIRRSMKRKLVSDILGKTPDGVQMLDFIKQKVKLDIMKGLDTK